MKSLLLLPLLALSTTLGAQDAPKPAETPAPAAPSPSWFQEITLNGFASVAYVYNTNRPAAGLNGFRVFDFQDDSISLDVAEIVIQKSVSKAGDTGFRVDLEAGSSIPKLEAAAGLKSGDFDVQQAFLSWMAASWLRVDAGKFVTHMGYELIEGYDGYNDNYSRSLLFGYAVPFTHTGIKGTATLGDKATLMVVLTNGWDNAKDNNRAKSFGTSLVLTPSKQLTFYVNYLGGPERDANDDDWRHVVDVSAVFSPTDWLSLALNADYGVDQRAGAGGRDDATWKGLAVYARFGSPDSFALTLRAEEFRDDDGVRTGVGDHRLREITVTPSLKLGKGLTLRSDIRFDSSNKPVFEKSDASTRDTQTTVALNAVYVF